MLIGQWSLVIGHQLAVLTGLMGYPLTINLLK
jgi:hypothetical protein